VALDLDRFLPYRLSVLANRVSRALAAQYRDRFGISIPEWRVLAVLGRDSRLPAVEIAARTRMDKVKVSRAIAALLRKGLVRRQRDPADRRVTRIEATARGREVYGAIARLALDWQARWLSDCDDGVICGLWQALDLLEARLDALEVQPSDGERSGGRSAAAMATGRVPAEEEVR
jgi:DNA-binding MarR family transcriptional regulator